MNLQIEIPENIEYDLISLEKTFENVCEKKKIELDNLNNIYNNCKTEEDFLFLNNYTLLSIDNNTVKKGDKLLYIKDNENKFVTISEIHNDDYPNTYFTIRFIETGKEKQTTSENLKIVDYPGFNLAQKKRKREFASYENETNFFVASCRFMYYEHDNLFTKLYIFEDDFKKNIIISKIICEIYFQKYVTNFSQPDKCNFLVPQIYNYGFVNTSYFKNQLVFYFTMENTNSVTLSKINELKLNNSADYFIKYMKLKYKAISINRCLKRKGFYHNDLHSNNIMINGDNDELFLVDYGESSKIENNVFGFQNHQYCVDCDHEKCYSRFFF